MKKPIGKLRRVLYVQEDTTPVLECGHHGKPYAARPSEIEKMTKWADWRLETSTLRARCLECSGHPVPPKVVATRLARCLAVLEDLRYLWACLPMSDRRSKHYDAVWNLQQEAKRDRWSESLAGPPPPPMCPARPCRSRDLPLTRPSAAPPMGIGPQNER